MHHSLVLKMVKEKLGITDPNWDIYGWESLGSPVKLSDGKFGYESIGMKLTGSVTPPPLLKGPRKGKPNWKKQDKSTIRECVVSKEDSKSYAENYEKETGICSQCAGSGRVVWGVSVDKGTTYRPCGACGGTGKAGWDV